MTTTTSKLREAALVSDRWLRPMMGLGVWEALPARDVPYELSDPFILLHEATLRPSQMADMDTEHPHRGFDNLWYILKGTAAQATLPARAGRSKGRTCPRARCCSSGPDAAHGTRKA